MAIPSWVWVAVPAVLTIAAVVAVQADDTEPILVPPGADGVDQAWDQLGMPDGWRQWGRWVALGESGWHITAQNGKPSSTSKMHLNERAAAWKGYQRLVNQGRWPCAAVNKSTAPGSGGYYGQLWPLTTVFAKKSGAVSEDMYCDPVAVWRSPRASTLAHIGQVRGTIAIAKRKLGGAMPTRLQLRAMYGNPSRDPAKVDTAKRRDAYARSTAKAGLPPSWLDEQIGPLPFPSLGLEAGPIVESDDDLVALLSEAIGMQYAAQNGEPAA